MLSGSGPTGEGAGVMLPERSRRFLWHAFLLFSGAIAAGELVRWLV